VFELVCSQIKNPVWTVVFLLVSLFSSVVAADEPVEVNLSDSERQWLQEHQDIVIAYDGDFPPYSAKLPVGDFQGYAVDVVKIIEQRLGIKFKVYPDGVWKNLYDAAKKREVDVVVTMNPIPERRQWFIFSDDYIFLSTTLFARVNDHRFPSASKISLARISLVEGYAGNASLLESFPDTTPVLFQSMTEALSAVNEGEADIYFGPDNIANYLLREHDIQNVEAKFIYEQNVSEQTFGIRNDWPELAPIINKALASITRQEWDSLNKQWIEGEREKLNLTSEERAWLAAHPVIRVHNEKDWPPWNFNRGNQPMGYSIDYMNLITKRLGIRVEYITGPDWNEFLDLIRNKDLDVMLNLSYTEEREKYINYTDGYLTALNGIYTKESEPAITSLEQVAREEKSLAVPKGFFNHQVLEKHYPEIKLVLVKDQMATITAVLAGQADAAIGREGVMNYLITERLVAGIKLTGIVEDKRFKGTAGIGVRKDWPILRDIIQKAMLSIHPNELMELRRKWAVRGDSDRQIRLTEEEKSFLQQHPVLRFGYDIDWPPVEYADKDGHYHGISSEYMKLIAESLGITLEPAPPQSWQDTIAAAKAWQLDVLSAVARTPQRDEYLHFSSPYLSVPMVYVTGLDYSFIGNIETLEGKTFAVVEGYASHDILKNKHPELKLLPVEDLKAGLKAVQKGDADVYIGSLTSISHLMSREGIPGLKISGELPYRYELSIATRKDQPLLAGIMQKALDAIPEEKRVEIFNRWVSVTYDRGFDYTLLWQLLSVIAVGFCLIVLWNLSLKRKVKERTMALEASQDLLRAHATHLQGVREEEKESIAREVHDELGSAMTALKLGMAWVDEHLPPTEQAIIERVSSLEGLVNDASNTIRRLVTELRPTILDDMGLWAAIEWQLGEFAKHHDIDVQANIDSRVELPKERALAVYRILQEALTNVAKHSRATTIRFDCWDRDGVLHITLEDNGIGISEDITINLTSYGLRGMYERINAVGGKLEVLGTPGEGTLLTIEVPHNEDRGQP
jgi:ABC-type amino acid transport substrate-binding protein